MGFHICGSLIFSTSRSGSAQAIPKIRLRRLVEAGPGVTDLDLDRDRDREVDIRRKAHAFLYTLYYKNYFVL